VEQPFAMPKAAGMQLLVRFGNSPGGASLSGTRGLLTTIRRGERALLIDEFDDLSNVGDTVREMEAAADWASGGS
jgi:hypothetical protein